jgi:hypothetical protein
MIWRMTCGGREVHSLVQLQHVAVALRIGLVPEHDPQCVEVLGGAALCAEPALCELAEEVVADVGDWPGLEADTGMASMTDAVGAGMTGTGKSCQSCIDVEGFTGAPLRLADESGLGHVVVGVDEVSADGHSALRRACRAAVSATA